MGSLRRRVPIKCRQSASDSMGSFTSMLRTEESGKKPRTIKTSGEKSYAWSLTGASPGTTRILVVWYMPKDSGILSARLGEKATFLCTSRATDRMWTTGSQRSGPMKTTGVREPCGTTRFSGGTTPRLRPPSISCRTNSSPQISMTIFSWLFSAKRMSKEWVLKARGSSKCV